MPPTIVDIGKSFAFKWVFTHSTYSLHGVKNPPYSYAEGLSQKPMKLPAAALDRPFQTSWGGSYATPSPKCATSVT